MKTQSKYLLMFALIFTWVTTANAARNAFSVSRNVLQSASSVTRSAQAKAFPGGTSYSFTIRATDDASYTHIFIPADNAVSGTMTYYATSDSDSVFTNVSYGSAWDVSSSEEIYYVETLRDSAMYWYKDEERHEINFKPGYFPAPYLVIDVSNGWAGTGTWVVDLTLRVFIKEE